MEVYLPGVELETLICESDTLISLPPPTTLFTLSKMHLSVSHKASLHIMRRNFHLWYALLPVTRKISILLELISRTSRE